MADTHCSNNTEAELTLWRRRPPHLSLLIIQTGMALPAPISIGLVWHKFPASELAQIQILFVQIEKRGTILFVVSGFHQIGNGWSPIYQGFFSSNKVCFLGIYL